jgi:hypothetical protein
MRKPTGKKYTVPSEDECKKYEMFSGKVTDVNSGSVELKVPTKKYPVLVSIDDFVDAEVHVEEGDLVGVHLWVLHNGDKGSYARIIKYNNEQSHFLRRVAKKRSMQATICMDKLPEHTGEKLTAGRNLFDVAAEKLGKTRTEPPKKGVSSLDATVIFDENYNM